uniref:cannabinoid receptor 1-like n=1 Tax=Ciona intestinalis TaxID=7719 RepID=UPI00089DCE09|nr:cannabinoid receptor 1-like [Ciona intestinalis]|eukprot:XP_018669442.1 cannabinoid receptor 1-like [Ciona intestinalis]
MKISTSFAFILLLTKFDDGCTMTATEPSHEAENKTLNFSTYKNCVPYRGKTITPRSDEILCCNTTYDEFTRRWYFGQMYLSEVFESLRAWKCPQFESECRQPIFAFTDFTRLVYKRACNYTDFKKTCLNTVKDFVDPSNSSGLTSNDSNEWSLILRELSQQSVPIDPAPPPCVQVALYDAGRKFGEYYEAISTFLPFCGILWCGTAANSSMTRSFSLWSCMNTGCRASIMISFIIIILLATMTILVNGCVILVFIRNKKLLNSQGIYKTSLACADFLVGAFVLTTCAHSLYSFPMTGRNTGQASSNFEVGPLKSVFNDSYMMAVGFVTTLSISVSIYSLMLASFDRLSVVRKPLKYNLASAKEFSIRATLVLWCVALLFSVLPFMVHSLRFSIVASLLVASSGSSALIVYCFSFVIPLITTWVVTAATCYYSFSHARERMANDFKTEFKLAKTLIIMVSVFSLSLSPTICSLVGGLLARGIYYHRPGSLVPSAASVYVSFEFVSVVILLANSSWNFFIYNARNESFKTATRQLFKVPESISNTARVSATTVTTAN